MRQSSRERWRAIVGYEGHYEVSDLGRVRSVDRIVRDGRTPNGTRRRRGQPMSLGRHPFGYPQVKLSRDSKAETILVHTAVLTAFAGPCPAGKEACHGGNGHADSSLANLRWDTRAENMRDRGRHGTDWQLNKSRCPRKHLYAGPNLVTIARRRRVNGEVGPHRECRACKRAHDVCFHARKTGRVEPDFGTLADLKYEQIMRGWPER